MARINESKAAEAFIDSLKNGKYNIEHSQADTINYNNTDEQDTLAVKEFTKSTLFKQFKDLF